MIRTLIIFGALIGPVAVAEPIDRTKMWTDAEVDAQARKWGEEVAREDGASAQHEGLAKWRKDIFNSDQLPANERIDLLSKALDNISRFSIYQVSERIEVYDMAREKMASIPGHADYFADKIEESWKSNAERVRTAEAKPEWQALLEKMKDTAEGEKIMFSLNRDMWGDYPDISSEGLRMLGHIPSTESVRALGHYLRKRDEPEIKKYNSPGTGFSAAKSLTEMISDGPIQTWMASWEDVPRWQQWFDELKAGKRTFRFVGSNVDYTLDGPADAKTLERIRNKTTSVQHSTTKRDRAIVTKVSAGDSAKEPVIYSGVIAALLLFASALAFLYLRNHKLR